MRMNELVRDYVRAIKIGDSVVYQDNQEFHRGVVTSIDGDRVRITGTTHVFSQETTYSIEKSDQPPRIMYPTEAIHEKLRKHEKLRALRDKFASLFDVDVGYPDRFLRSAWASLCRARDSEFPTTQLPRSEYLLEIRDLLDDDWHYELPIKKIEEMVDAAKDLGLST